MHEASAIGVSNKVLMESQLMPTSPAMYLHRQTGSMMAGDGAKPGCQMQIVADGCLCMWA